MSVKLRFVELGLTLALATSGCIPMEHFRASLANEPQLEAWGPETVFPTVEDAAIDALIYTYLQSETETDTQRMRGGTIYRVDKNFSYGEIYAARGLLSHRISYPLRQQDAARFHMYAITTDHAVNRANERASQGDRRSVDVTDPLHRPLFILHPSLAIREYRGSGKRVVALADLRRSQRAILIARGGVEGLMALQQEGHDLYIREGCSRCHPSMVRPRRAENERYGEYTLAGESAVDHSSFLGSKQTGPDLSRVTRRYSDGWHRTHLIDPRSVVPESNMPGFPWLAEKTLSADDTVAEKKTLRAVGAPCEDVDIEGAQQAVACKTHVEAVIAYLQQLGPDLEVRR
jgi:cytochrome c oxidase cbb3-type subunit 2